MSIFYVCYMYVKLPACQVMILILYKLYNAIYLMAFSMDFLLKILLTIRRLELLQSIFVLSYEILICIVISDT